ncbi:MAG TPA: Ku protein [bacterium]|nr:Ku protein [bacterium]
MPRAIWSGSISFGLVNIPVELYPATRDTGLHFNQLHREDMARVQYKTVCSADGEELDRAEIVKGFPVGRDEYVVVEPEELEALAPEASRAIDITDFVELSDIDPLFFDRPYYLVPSRNAAKPYHLLREAMEQSGKVAIATFVMRQKEYLAALRPTGGAMGLFIMRFADELVEVSELGGLADEVAVSDKELKMARQLIDSLSGTFEPTKYRDEYKARVLELIEAKAEGEEVTTSVQAVRKSAKVIDLVTALEQSLKATKAKGGGAKEVRVEVNRSKAAAKGSTARGRAKATPAKRSTKAPTKTAAARRKQSA